MTQRAKIESITIGGKTYGVAPGAEMKVGPDPYPPPKPGIFRTWTDALAFFSLVLIGTAAIIAAVYVVASWAAGVMP